MANYSEVGGENVELLRAIINDTPYTGEITSRNSAILDSIIKGSAYTDPPQSEIEALLLDLKEKIEGGGSIEVEELNVTENGTYTADIGKAFNPVNVDIASPVLITKNITANGVYNASADNADGYATANVNVPLPENAYLLKSIEGVNIATFADGTDNFVKSLEVAIEPQQEGSGEPSPTNIRPISGWSAVDVTRTGKNLFGGEYMADVIVSKVTYATKNTTNKTVTYSANRISGVVLFKNFKPNTQYTIIANMNSGSTNLKINYSDGTKTSIQANDVTVSTEGKTVMSLSGEWQTGDSVLSYEQFGIFEGVLTASDFEPYNGTTITIQLGDTRYGGKLDVVSGVLTVTHEIKKVNTLNWYYLQNTFYSGSVGISADGSPDINSDFVCTFAKSVNKEWNQLSNNECTLRKNLYSQGYYSLCVKNTEYTDATEFKNSLDSSCEITFPLATPIEVQLTPTIVKSLQGDNNFFASTGEIELLQYWGKEQN